MLLSPAVPGVVCGRADTQEVLQHDAVALAGIAGGSLLW